MGATAGLDALEYKQISAGCWKICYILCLCNYSDLKNAPMPRNFLKRESVTGGVFSLSLFLTSLLTM